MAVAPLPFATLPPFGAGGSTKVTPGPRGQVRERVSPLQPGWVRAGVRPTLVRIESAFRPDAPHSTRRSEEEPEFDLGHGSSRGPRPVREGGRYRGGGCDTVWEGGDTGGRPGAHLEAARAPWRPWRPWSPWSPRPWPCPPCPCSPAGATDRAGASSITGGVCANRVPSTAFRQGVQGGPLRSIWGGRGSGAVDGRMRN